MIWKRGSYSKGQRVTGEFIVWIKRVNKKRVIVRMKEGKRVEGEFVNGVKQHRSEQKWTEIMLGS